MHFYTGIGSRRTPMHDLNTMVDLARLLAQNDFVLRSGAADGADKAFERGCDMEHGEKEIYIPWNGFNQRRLNEDGVFVGANEPAMEMAKKFHPNWDACTPGAKMLHARNMFQVLGHDLQTPSTFVLCWTPGGSGQGGTGQALRLARANNIPVFDLGGENVLSELDTYLQSVS